MKAFLKQLFSNPVLANIFMLMILACGAAGYYTMIREIFPRFDLDIISITVTDLGVDPKEIEEGISIKIEEALAGTEGVKKITTLSQEGISSVRVECNDNADVDEVKDRVENRVNAITTFPKDAEKPIIAKLEFKDLVCALVIWGDASERELKETARIMEQELQQVKGISQTSIVGIRDYEISIEVSEAQLRKYNLNFSELSKKISANGINLSGGTIRTSNEDIRIKTSGRRYSAKEYRKIPIVAKKDGTYITLGEIATIKDSFDEETRIDSIFNGKPAVSINIYKTASEDSINIVKSVDKFIKNKSGYMPSNIHLSKFFDRSRMVKERLSMLISNGILGLLLVFVTLWMFLDIRLSFWVAMGIPISLAGALAIMAIFGASINMISMFGMIMVLGIIVDDAIVVGESIYHHRQKGAKDSVAAINGTAEVAWPVIAAVLTTIVAFLPLFFIPGIMGKFIRVMPVPVVAALFVSLFEGLFILPVHLRHLPSPGATPKFKFSKYMRRFRDKLGNGLDYFIEFKYAKWLNKALHNRYIALSLALFTMVLVAGVIKNNFLKFNLLPETDEDFISARIEFVAGAPLEEMKKAIDKLTTAWEKVSKNPKFLKKSNGVPISNMVYGLVGTSIDWKNGNNPNKIEVSIELYPAEKRNIQYKKLITAWKKEVGDIPNAVSTSFGAFKKGPGGLPIAINLMSNDQTALLKAADELAYAIKKRKGTYDVSDDFRLGKREFDIKLKPEAAIHGLTLLDIAKHVQSGFFGNEALRIQIGKDDVKVKVRYPESEGRDSVSNFKKLRIKDKNGNMIPISSLVKISLKHGDSTIIRQKRMRRIEVSADVDKRKGNANTIIKDLEANILPKLEKKYGVTVDISGQQQETRESLGSLFFTFPIAMFCIYFIIASIFRSYIQPIVIMTTIPFGMIGAIIGHLVFGMNLAIFSIFGMVALAGIVVNDAIVFIEGANGRLEAGDDLFTALIEAGKRRFRAIMLTTMTTFAGLMPIMLERSMQAAFLKPMAISIAFGVLFATIITLVLIPCFIVILNDIKRGIYYLIYNRMPTREEVESRANNK